MKAVIVGTCGIGAVLAVHVARNGIAGKPAQQRATDHGAAIAMTDRATQHAAGQGAQNRAAGMISAAAGIGESRAGPESQRRAGSGGEENMFHANLHCPHRGDSNGLNTRRNDWFLTVL